MRLQKFLANAGVASRRKAEEMILAGRITVNGQQVTELGTKISPEDTVTADGKIIEPQEKNYYIMLHKPEGVISSTKDPQGRRVVTDLVPGFGKARLFPVGRLDYDSSGLILLTNDGELAQKLTHPSYEAAKTYIAKLNGIPSKENLERFRTGIYIEGKKTAPAKIKIFYNKTDKERKTCKAQIVIKEGRNRQIRKMCAAMGTPLIELKRVAVGNLQLGNLPRGAYRQLTKGELILLQNSLPEFYEKFI